MLYLTGIISHAALNTAPLGQDRHTAGIERRAGGVEHWNAALQSAKATAAAKAIPNPITAIATGSYSGILNIVGPLMAPTPLANI